MSGGLGFEKRPFVTRMTGRSWPGQNQSPWGGGGGKDMTSKRRCDSMSQRYSREYGAQNKESHGGTQSFKGFQSDHAAAGSMKTKMCLVGLRHCRAYLLSWNIMILLQGKVLKSCKQAQKGDQIRPSSLVVRMKSKNKCSQEYAHVKTAPHAPSALQVYSVY